MAPMNLRLALVAVVVPLVAAACGSSQPAATTAPAAPSTSMDDGEAQAARGAKLYAEKCASCHGDSGQGAKAPAVAGKNALPLDPRPDQKYRKVQFKTALD